MSILSTVEEKRLAELREKAVAKGYTPTEKAELAELEAKAAGVVAVEEEDIVDSVPAGDDEDTNTLADGELPSDGLQGSQDEQNSPVSTPSDEDLNPSESTYNKDSFNPPVDTQHTGGYDHNPVN